MLPTFRGKGQLPPLCGPIPAPHDYKVPAGDLVAARNPAAESDSPDWILAEVSQYFPDRDEYEVEDVADDDEGAGNAPNKFVLPSSSVIPLPKLLPDAQRRVELPVGSKVLAMYPGTTCFYEAQVIQPPSRRKKENE